MKRLSIRPAVGVILLVSAFAAGALFQHARTASTSESLPNNSMGRPQTLFVGTIEALLGAAVAWATAAKNGLKFYPKAENP